MNNSGVFIPPEKPDILTQLQEKEVWLTKVIESAETIHTSQEWSTLKTELFDPMLEKLEKLLKEEALKVPAATEKLAHIAGQLEAIKKLDLPSLAAKHRIELAHIKQQLHG